MGINRSGVKRLSLNELKCVTGGQIYEVWDEEKQINCYLVPDIGLYHTYYNKTQAAINSAHLPRKDIVLCKNWDDAILFANSDCAYYKIIELYK